MKLNVIQDSTWNKIKYLLRKTVKNGCTPEEEKSAKAAAKKLLDHERYAATAAIDMHSKINARLRNKA